MFYRLTALLLLLALGCSEPLDPPAATPSPPGRADTSTDAAPESLRTPDATTALQDTTVDRQDLPEGLVYLSDVAPTIVQEMRYTTSFNFTGAPVEGYEAGRCILTREAAEALAAVHADLGTRGLGLKVYDCYRPQQAVDSFVRWARTSERSMKPVFYPNVIKGRLFADGYIASRSGHSRASTVDLTIVPLPAPPQPPYPSPDAYAACTAPAGERFADNSLDMGTGYDCFSPLSHTDNPAVGEAALANRHLLREAMSRHGFRNYAKEWWHYTLRAEPFPDTYFDIPVR